MRKHRSCYFCRKHLEAVDYLDGRMLQRHMGTWSKMKSGRETGTCSKHQRRVTDAVKRARFMAVLPYASR